MLYLREDSRDVYEVKVEERKAHWDTKFIDYYEKCVERIVDKVSKWSAEKIGWAGKVGSDT